jgi:DNA-binding NarL/FixJ family response regulator
MEAFGEIRGWSPETRVCLVTGFTAAGLAAQWLQAGVDGILLKSCPPETVARGLTVLLDGGRFVAPEVEAALARPSGDGLSLRERQVLHLIVEGQTNAQIGHRLSISAKTVDNHRTRMMAKLGVRSTAQLLALALREGLLDPTRQG